MANVNKVTTKKSSLPKVLLIIGAIIGGLFLLLLIIGLFIKPSAKSVFNEMLENMLQTKAVVVDLNYQGKGSEESVSMTSKTYLDMRSNTDLKAAGNFEMNVTANNVPITAKADYVVIGENKYIKFSELSATGETATYFNQVESKIKNQWIKSRSGDNFSTFAAIPIEATTTILPTPYANLNGDQRKNVLDILQDKSTFTIEETSKVEVNGVDNYKYVISYNKDQYAKMAKLVDSYVEYLKYSGSEDGEIKNLEVWVDIHTKLITKMHFEGTSKNGDIEGTIVFSNYDKIPNITKPDDYSLESELTN
jgi:hypothetical protein